MKKRKPFYISSLISDTKLTYYFDFITLKEQLKEKHLPWWVHSSCYAERNLVKNEKKRALITEMNHQDGVEKESVNAFSLSITKTFWNKMGHQVSWLTFAAKPKITITMTRFTGDILKSAYHQRGWPSFPQDPCIDSPRCTSCHSFPWSLTFCNCCFATLFFDTFNSFSPLLWFLRIYKPGGTLRKNILLSLSKSTGLSDKKRQSSKRFQDG